MPRKHVTLELGGNAAVIVAPDYDDLAWAAQRIATFTMAQAGQSCVSVQRVLCVAERYDELRERVVAHMQALGTGDPAEPTTEVGPLIDTAAVQRVQGWVQQAVDAGARLLCGGIRDGSSYTPTVLEDVTAGSRVLDDEVFGPVLVLRARSLKPEGDQAGHLRLSVLPRRSRAGPVWRRSPAPHLRVPAKILAYGTAALAPAPVRWASGAAFVLGRPGPPCRGLAHCHAGCSEHRQPTPGWIHSWAAQSGYRASIRA